MPGGSVILRTSQIYVLDLADLALNEAGIPHFARVEGASGLEFAMPAAPSAAPGVWWTIHVSREHEAGALAVIGNLPSDRESVPSVTARCYSPATRVHCRIVAWILLAISIAGILFAVIDALLP